MRFYFVQAYDTLLFPRFGRNPARPSLWRDSSRIPIYLSWTSIRNQFPPTFRPLAVLELTELRLMRFKSTKIEA